MTDRYACSAIDSIWTVEAQYSRWLKIWQAANTATNHRFDVDGMTVDAWVAVAQTYEDRYGHDVASAVEALRVFLENKGQLDAARWLHYGLCSSDVVDAGWLLAFKETSVVLYKLARDAIVAIGGIRDPWLNATYRTHGQAAQVGRSDYRWHGHWRALMHAAATVRDSTPDTAGFDGPTGTGSTLTSAQVIATRSALGLGSRATHDGRQAADREEWVTWLQSVARLATVCERFATDVRLLAQTGVNEVREPTGAAEYRGSSSMPHKRNPTRSERICGLAPVIRGMVSGYAEAAASCWGSHSLEHSSAERVVIPQVTSLVGFILVETASIAAGLDVNGAAVTRNVIAAPEDSYLRRNQLIVAGAEGDTWQAAKEQT